MAITYHSGRRIQGTSTDFGTAGAGIPAVVTQGGWKELGRHTLTSASDYLEVSGIADKKYYMIVWNTPDGTASWCQPALRLGIGSVDTSANYGERYWRDGVFGAAQMNTYNGLWSNAASPNKSCFGVSYISNESDREKLIMNSSVDVTNPPSRMQSAGKWTDVSDPIDLVRLEHMATGNGFNTGSELVVLGWDPTDTHTTNFWEELASVDLSGGAASTLSTGTFTNKKYLWIQCFLDMTTTQIPSYRINNVSTGTPYSSRYSNNGAADAADVSQNQVALANYQVNNTFQNMFIVNNGTDEPLGISHAMVQGAAGAGTAPSRAERVFKTSNTTAITRLDWGNFAAGSGNYGTNSFVKVWGSN